MCIYTYTHTHTNMYIYIYVYVKREKYLRLLNSDTNPALEKEMFGRSMDCLIVYRLILSRTKFRIGR